MTFQVKDSITVNETLAINSSGQVVTPLAVSSTSTSSITNTNSAGGTTFSITGTPYLPVGNQTWAFKTGTSLGAPASWMSWPDGTNQLTAYPGTATTSNVGGVQPDGTSITITSSGVITANAGSLAGTTLNSTVVSSSLTSVGTLTALTVSGTIAANGGSITSNQTTFSLVNTTPTTVNFAGAATTLNVGYTSTSASTTNISTGAVASSTTKTVNIGTGSASGSTTAVNLGSTSGSSTVTLNGITQIPQATVSNNVASTNVINLNTQGQLFSDGNLHLHSSGGSIWINALDGSDVNINTQVNSGVTGGGINVAGAVKSHSRIFDWTAMIHASPASGGSITGTLLGNASYSNSSDGVQLTPNSTNQTGVVAWNASVFDFTKDFVMEWAWFTSNSGTNPADGVWAFFGGSTNGGATQPPSLSNGSIAVRYLTYTNLKTQWYNNGSTTGNAVPFRAGITYQGEWMTSRIMVRSVGTKRYAYLYTGTSGVCDNAIDITSWSPSGGWIGVGASTGGNSSGQLCCHVALDYL
jgi:hypothetical protein